MEIAILAYPDEEAQRLEKVVLALPIDADGQMIDNKPERLPKQISRHLLPSTTNRRARQHLDDAVDDFLNDLGPPKPRRRKDSTTNAPVSRHTSTSASTSPPKSKPINIAPPPLQTQSSKPIERERMPYSGTPITSDTAINESAAFDTTSVPIERERQPYTAALNTGRIYENLNVPTPRSRERANSATRPSDPESSAHAHHRTSSTTSYQPPPRPASVRRPASPPLKSFSNSTPGSLGLGDYASDPRVSSSNFNYPATSTTFTPTPNYTTFTQPSAPAFDTRERERDRDRDNQRERDEDARRYAAREPRRSADEDPRIAALLNNPRDPRDAERYDRYERGGAYDDEYYRNTGRGYDTGYPAKRY